MWDYVILVSVMEIEQFKNAYAKVTGFDSKIDFCIDSLSNANSTLEDYIFSVIVNFNSSKLSEEKLTVCEHLFRENLSNPDSEIRAWIPLGISTWNFVNLIDDIIQLSATEKNFMVMTCIYRALDKMFIKSEMPEHFKKEIENFLLNPEYHRKESYRNIERATEMLRLMGFAGMEIYCKLILDVERPPLQFFFNSDYELDFSNFLNGTWVTNFNSFTTEEKLKLESYFKEMATVAEGLTFNWDDMGKLEEKRPYTGWQEWFDKDAEDWNYFRYEKGEGLIQNCEDMIDIGIRGLGEINTPSATDFLIDYFNSSLRNNPNTSYRNNAEPGTGYLCYRFKALTELENKQFSYSKIRETINQFLKIPNDRFESSNVINVASLRGAIAKFLSKYGSDPDSIFDRLLEDIDPYVRLSAREYFIEMGGSVDIQKIVDDILVFDSQRFSNLKLYLMIEENLEVNLIHRCIGELVDEDWLEWLKDMIKGVGEFEEIEIPFKRKNPEIVDEWIRLIEQRISVIESE